MRQPETIRQAIKALSKLPGIGQKTANRLVFYILSQHRELGQEISDTLLQACTSIHLCPECCNFTDTDLCPICTDAERNRNIICIVESASDVEAIEKTGVYHGLYHVLHGSISPLRNIGPNDIHLKELFNRLLQNPAISEIILANNVGTEGESTALYIARLLQPSGIKISQMAHGIPVGSNLDFADEVTLGQAISNRREIERPGS